MDKTLFISALHGDEGFSIDVLKRVQSTLSSEEYSYDIVIGNPMAQQQNIRFTELDLNRVAPGDISSPVYEEKRAAELIELSKNYSCAIDIHGTDANTGIFTLVTNPTIENLLLASSIPCNNIVIWAVNASKTNGPVTQHLRCPAVEIECGPKSSPQVQDELYNLIMNFFNNKSLKMTELLNEIKKRRFFRVYGSIEDIDTSNMKEFEDTEVNGERFYPLLINSYKKGSVRKMQPIDFFSLLSY